jgi:hypothetical protein
VPVIVGSRPEEGGEKDFAHLHMHTAKLSLHAWKLYTSAKHTNGIAKHTNGNKKKMIKKGDAAGCCGTLNHQA